MIELLDTAQKLTEPDYHELNHHDARSLHALMVAHLHLDGLLELTERDAIDIIHSALCEALQDVGDDYCLWLARIKADLNIDHLDFGSADDEQD